MTTPPPSANTLDLRPLMFETFVCTLAVMSFVALVGPLARKLGLAPWQAGAAVTVGGIAWMLAARPWGIASDRHGRRRILLGGLAGFALSYGSLCLFIVLALHWTLPTLFAFAGIVLLRGLAGGFYAAVPACTAALVADHVEAQRRAAALAGLGAASAIGMVIGPGLAGLLATHGLVLPLLVTGALPLVALLALWRWLPREERRQPNRGAALAIGDRRLRRPLAVGFVAMFSVTVAQITVGFFALDRLRLDSADAARVAGIALTAVGVALILAQLLVRRLDWPPPRLIRVGGLVAAIGFAAVCFADSPPLLWLAFFVAAAGMGWVFPAVSALNANAVRAEEQGAAAGTLVAVHGFGLISGPLLGTLLHQFDSRAPLRAGRSAAGAGGVLAEPTDAPRGNEERSTMTAVDLLLVATLLAALLAWWIPALPGRRGLLALASTLALGAGLYAAWDDRWQAGVGAFAGFSLLLGACLRRKPERGLPFRTGSLYGLLVLLAIAALYLFPVAPLPAPSGPYAVGVRDFELDDPSRPGLLGTPAGQPRRLLVRAWYPARPIAGAAPRHYFDPGEARSTARGFGEILGFPPLLAYLKHLRTNSYPDAPLRDDSARLPVVFYSHGYSAFAGGNWTLMEELASHGYAVYAIQHSGDASPTRLPDGTLLPMDPGLVEHLRRAAHDGLPQAMRQGYVSDDLDQRLDGQLHTALDLPAPANRAINLSAPVWLADRLFVHDRLQAGEVPDRVADLVAASDFAHTGEMGMSFGGSTTGAVCMVDRRCAAAVNLDGGDFDFAPFDSDLPAPLLMLHADLGNFYRLFGIEPPARPRSFNDFSYERFEHAGQRQDIHRLVLRDSAHAGLTDNPLFIRRPLRDGLLGSAPTEVLIQAPNALVLGFFDHYLRGRANDFPQAQMARFPAWLTRYDNSAVRDWWLAKPEAQRLALRQRIDEMKRRKTGLDLP
ncbi:MFS transporter [Pseudomonas aeruginosa]|uniref:MFS transporter n=10 Tax=Pseudomonas aeruginosa TaxID=287 RepID=UPI000B100379